MGRGLVLASRPAWWRHAAEAFVVAVAVLWGGGGGVVGWGVWLWLELWPLHGMCGLDKRCMPVPVACGAPCGSSSSCRASTLAAPGERED